MAPRVRDKLGSRRCVSARLFLVARSRVRRSVVYKRLSAAFEDRSLPFWIGQLSKLIVRAAMQSRYTAKALREAASGGLRGPRLPRLTHEFKRLAVFDHFEGLAGTREKPHCAHVVPPTAAWCGNLESTRVIACERRVQCSKQFAIQHP